MSGVFFGGYPGRILEAWRDERLEVVLSREIIAEYVRVGDVLGERFPGVDLQECPGSHTDAGVEVGTEPCTKAG